MEKKPKKQLDYETKILILEWCTLFPSIKVDVWLNENELHFYICFFFVVIVLVFFSKHFLRGI